MRWFRRKSRGPSQEALAALEFTKLQGESVHTLRPEVARISAQLKAHRDSNGFAELVASMYGTGKK